MMPAECSASAVVFAYHDVGVRCLEVLIDSGVDVRLVVTHADNPEEKIWFGSVADVADRNGIPVLFPDDPNGSALTQIIRKLAPDLLFSFYYRKMLSSELTDIPATGAFNIHGSLLPRYRGRVPVNWAVLNGEPETGVSLHRMTEKPDAGNLVAQKAIPVLSNDTAGRVFAKLTCAAESLLMESLPGLVAGNVVETPLDLTQGSYFGGRRPEDGLIDWSQPAWSIHNLIRAVAPPYPGAYFDAISGEEICRVRIPGSYFRAQPAQGSGPRIYWQGGWAWADCIDGLRLMITEIEVGGETLDASSFRSLFGDELGPDRLV
jgi:methionyl-tRNA formyltransferase